MVGPVAKVQPARVREDVAAVPGEPGRMGFPALSGKRAKLKEVPFIPLLPALLKVDLPDGEKDKGRPGRKARAAIPAVAAVDPYFPNAAQIKSKLAGSKTVDEILKMLPPVPPWPSQLIQPPAK
jgi:hypothetical protein